MHLKRHSFHYVLTTYYNKVWDKGSLTFSFYSVIFYLHTFLSLFNRCLAQRAISLSVILSCVTLDLNKVVTYKLTYLPILLQGYLPTYHSHK